MTRLYDAGLIDGPSAITVDGGTIENPLEPNSYGRNWNGGTIRTPIQVNRETYPALDNLLVMRSFIAEHDNNPQSVGSWPFGDRDLTPIYQSIRYQERSFANVVCSSIFQNHVSQRNTYTATLSSNPATPIAYERRNDHSAPSVDLSCISPWNSEGGSFQCGTLINPTHCIHANHSGFFLNNGATIKFVSMSNVVHERTVIANQQIGTSDLHISRLNEALPPDIVPAIFPPADALEYLEVIRRREWSLRDMDDIWTMVYPCYRINRLREIGVRLLVIWSLITQQTNPIPILVASVSSPFWGNLFSVDPIPVGGDSGAPVFWPFRNRVMPIFMAWSINGVTVNTVLGSAPLGYLSEIEAFAGPVEVADLSEFTKYA